MPNNISKATIKILLIQYDRPGCQGTSYSDRTQNLPSLVKNNL